MKPLLWVQVPPFEYQRSACQQKNFNVIIRYLINEQEIFIAEKLPLWHSYESTLLPALTRKCILSHTYTYVHVLHQNIWQTSNRIRNITEIPWSATAELKLQFKLERELNCLENVQVKQLSFIVCKQQVCLLIYMFWLFTEICLYFWSSFIWMLESVCWALGGEHILTDLLIEWLPHWGLLYK